MTKETSNIADRCVFEAQLEEYRSLRTEILHRIELQYRITNYAIALFAGVLTVVVSIIGSGIIDRNLYFIILVTPWFFYIFALAYREQDFLIANLARYINTELTPKIASTFGVNDDNVFGWEQFLRRRTKWSLVDLIRANSRYTFLFLPNLVFLIIFLYFTLLFEGSSGWAIYEKLLFAVDILMFIDPILIAISTTKKYAEIAKDSPCKKGVD